MSSYELAMPSIPGSAIRLKVRDNRVRAFGCQHVRFPEDKSLLTSEFLNTFHNFHARVRAVTESGRKERPLTTPSPPRPEMRYFISHERKHLLKLIQPKTESLLEEPRRTHAFSEMRKTRAISEQRRTREVSFRKAEKEKEEVEAEIEVEEIKSKREHPSAVFKGEPRNNLYKRLNESAATPGPGTYSFERRRRARRATKVVKEEFKFGEEQLKRIIDSVVMVKPESNEERINKEKSKIGVNEGPVFVRSDRDRFGELKYPIVEKVKMPGPGTYDVGGSMEERVMRVTMVEQQRQLLLDWFKA